MANDGDRLVQSQAFEELKRKMDEETAIKDTLRTIVEELESQDRTTKSLLSQAHSTPPADLPLIPIAAEQSIAVEVQTIGRLSEVASQYPYYRFNHIWAREMQDVCFSVLMCGWLGGYNEGEGGRLLPIEKVGEIMNVPVNLKDRDAFHLTIEEYLHALISLVDELARLARNSVTLGDHARPPRIARFVKEAHGAFQVLNLKNDALRKRADGLKYRVKDVEDVVYDLGLRGLLTPRNG